MNISVVDEIVQEYCLYRGFTQSFRSIENEKTNDKTKNFEAQLIVQAIFDYLNNGAIENFISLWDFLNKRFFLHLDQEHIKMFGSMKSELIIYYLVACVKAKNKAKISEFFATFSHEILSPTCELDLRRWYVLPYLENPDADKEFAVYFTPRWLDNLRTVLFNYISLVLRSAPPPRLLLLERWFRSETQLEVRTALESARGKIEACGDVIDSLQDRIANLHSVLSELVRILVVQKPKSLFDGEAGDQALSYVESCEEHISALSSMKRDSRLQQLLGPGARAVFTPSPSSSSSSSCSDVSGLVSMEQQLLGLLKTRVALFKRISGNGMSDGSTLPSGNNSGDDIARLAYPATAISSNADAENDASSVSSREDEDDDAANTIATTGTEL